MPFFSFEHNEIVLEWNNYYRVNNGYIEFALESSSFPFAERLGSIFTIPRKIIQRDASTYTHEVRGLWQSHTTSSKIQIVKQKIIHQLITDQLFTFITETSRITIKRN